MSANAYARAVSANKDYQRRLEMNFTAIERKAAVKLCDLNMQKDSIVGDLVRIGTKTPDLRDYDRMRRQRTAKATSAVSKGSAISATAKANKVRKTKPEVSDDSSDFSDSDDDYSLDLNNQDLEGNKKGLSLDDRLDMFMTTDNPNGGTNEVKVSKSAKLYNSQPKGATVRRRKPQKSTNIMETWNLKPEMKQKYVGTTTLRRIDRAAEICKNLEDIQDNRDSYYHEKQKAKEEDFFDVKYGLGGRSRSNRCNCKARGGGKARLPTWRSVSQTRR